MSRDILARALAAADARRRYGDHRSQVVEQVIGQLKDRFALERHRAKTLGGLLARLAAKIAAFTAGEWINARHGRPIRQLADLRV